MTRIAVIGAAATAENLLAVIRGLPPEALWQVIAIGRSDAPARDSGDVER